jgi:hypothetical protein
MTELTRERLELLRHCEMLRAFPAGRVVPVYLLLESLVACWPLPLGSTANCPSPPDPEGPVNCRNIRVRGRA